MMFLRPTLRLLASNHLPAGGDCLSPTPYHFVQQVLDSFKITSGLERGLFSHKYGEPKIDKVNPCLVLSNQTTKGCVHFTLWVQDKHTNRLGILHGGTIASLVDLGGSLAVASMGLFATGVSTDLNVTYIGSGGKPKAGLQVTATCNKLGQNLAYTTVVFRNYKGEITARGSHTKYIRAAWKAQGDRPLYTVPAEAKDEMDRITTQERVDHIKREHNKKKRQEKKAQGKALKAARNAEADMESASDVATSEATEVAEGEQEAEQNANKACKHQTDDASETLQTEEVSEQKTDEAYETPKSDEKPEST